MSKVQYNINLELNQNKLIIKINDLDSSWMIRGYYLYKDGLLSKKVVKDNLEDNYEFTLENDGLYFVKVFVKKDEEMVSKNSLVVSYFKDETTNEFEKFLNLNLMEKTQNGVKLSQKGILLSNEVLCEFIKI